MATAKKIAHNRADKRRSTGSFYTPYYLAKHAWNMIVAQLGEHFWQDGTWRI